MHRRTFLATLGATAAAGCTAQTTPTGEEPTTAPPTETETTAPPTTDRPRERRTVETESTPTRGEVLVERGRSHLQTSIAEFVEAAGGSDATIVDVTAATTEFSRYDVDAAYREAKEDLNAALEHAEGAVADEARALLRAAEFVDVLGLAQIQLVNSYERLTVALRSFYTESYGELADDVGELRHQRELAAEQAETIEGSFDASVVAVVDGISGEHFDAKVAQIDGELATFEGLVASLDGIDASMEAFEDDADSYRTRQYEGVTFAPGDFEDARDDVVALEPAESLRPIVEEVECVFGALAEGAAAMQKVVLARRNDDVAAAAGHESEAEAEFRSCDHLVEEVRSVADLVDSF